MGKKKKTHLPFRINVLFFIIFLLFAFLILQLGVVQILHGEQAQKEIDRTENTITNVPVPRGLMYDRFGRALITNQPIYSITYTPPKNVQSKDKIELAEKLAKYIDKPDDKITEWDLKDYWIVKNQEEAYGRLSEKEQELDNTDQYHAVIDKVTDEDLEELTERDREVVAILRELNQAPALTPHIVKNEGVTEKEYAVVAEHLSELDGINVAIDWNRNNEFGSTFSNFIGSITSYDEGLPAENIDYYLTRNYSRNDRVGESGLEQQYESILKGQKKQIQNITDKDGDLVGTEVIHEGQQGKSLVLSIDIDLQQKVDKIVEEELEKVIKAHPSKNQYLTDALVVMMNPNTGEILSMSGKRYYRENEDENNPEAHFKDESFRTVYDAHRPGSAVKGATVLAGYESGVIDIGQTFYDTPIKIAGTPEKSSYTNLGYVNDLEALAKSSNVYMFYIAMRMGGEYNYVREANVKFDPDAFRQMRNYFKQFGLGVETGVDLPFESTGYQGSVAKAGLLMDYAIGQYDTYTALQLAQYVSTIANDGYRLRPHLVKEIRNPSTTDGPGSVAEVIQPEVLNKIDMEENELERVQEGFRRVFQHSDGTADHIFRNKDYKPAGKTGTAQNEVYRQNEAGEVVKVADVENLTLVGYAPYDNPEVAFAVIVPNVGLKAGDSINYYIGERILDAYFELKEQRSKNGIEIEDNENDEATNEEEEETEAESDEVNNEDTE
ncbi:peptidoglycan D,D-transpeptidase FtsI family protein [Salirhabdus sp. Marseille-P4669]|uniref:peptidoglycan D,D-transpeptidase FtsI family protein n=1 Tax=Salirhabdus sp. Marseille-P4669 TaxID=2042310 RepID=UPI000C79CE7F|nr:penicillin-binding protein 2 [Salirhabdus sp. Marseille-P4669]